jgi:pilus assembly protein Flp/PilA
MGVGAAKRFVRDESGATAIEYGLIAAGIGGCIAATVYDLGDTVLTQLWQKIANSMP